MRLGVQVSNFTWPEGPTQLGATFGRIAEEADGAGFASFWVMDHFFQISMIGPAENDMLEGYSALALAAARTKNIKLGTLVTGVTYRHPGILIKTATTLDVLSGGRAYLGIGAAWNEEEHRGLGIPYPPVAERFERLEETLQLAHQMWAGDERPFAGKHYQLDRPLNSPQALQRPHPPILIGGSGEKKTLRLVAQYADESNLICGADEIPRKLEALAGHCERLGRDRSEITVSYQGVACIAPSHDQAVAELDAMLAERGLDTTSLSEEEAAGVRAMVPHGDPDEVGQIFSNHLATGVDGFTVSAPANGHIEGRVQLLGETLARVVS